MEVDIRRKKFHPQMGLSLAFNAQNYDKNTSINCLLWRVVFSLSISLRKKTKINIIDGFLTRF